MPIEGGLPSKWSGYNSCQWSMNEFPMADKFVTHMPSK